jgi:hypothetical protein
MRHLAIVAGFLSCHCVVLPAKAGNVEEPDQVSLIQLPGSAPQRNSQMFRIQRKRTAFPLDESKLAPASKTEGGGFTGGHVEAGDFSPAPHLPAPATHFSQGCHWQGPKKVAVVHIGRTGGTSVVEMLLQTTVNFTHDHSSFHQKYFDPEDYDIFLVMARDPIKRVISAFNWRHPIGGKDDLNNLSPDEEKLYACYPELPGGVNNFAESLDDDTPCGYQARKCLHSPSAGCNHLAWRYDFYLNTGLDDRRATFLDYAKTHPRDMLLVGGGDNFTRDISTMWDWLCVPPEQRPELSEANSNYPRHNDTHLSPKAEHLLSAHLKDDYFALEELRKVAESKMGGPI